MCDRLELCSIFIINRRVFRGCVFALTVHHRCGSFVVQIYYMKAIIWGACGSLPTPPTPSLIREKLKNALWNARNESFPQASDVDAYLDTLPLSATGSYRGNTSCVEIQTSETDAIICDAGSGLRDYSLSIAPDAAARTYHFFISHLHWDHIQGFPFFAPAFQAGNRIVFHGHHVEMEAAIRAQMNTPCFPIPFESMQAEIEFDILEKDQICKIGAVTISAMRQKHPGDSWGYRFEANGKTIVYATDSEHSDELGTSEEAYVEFFKQADVLIFDGQYSPEDNSNAKRNWGHSDYASAIKLAALAQVHQLCIFHHEPGHSDTEIEDLYKRALEHHKQYHLLQESAIAERYPNKLCLAYDGLHLTA